MKTVENCWKLLKSVENCWKLLKTVENCWKLLNTVDIFWKLWKMTLKKGWKWLKPVEIVEKGWNWMSFQVSKFPRFRRGSGPWVEVEWAGTLLTSPLCTIGCCWWYLPRVINNEWQRPTKIYIYIYFSFRKEIFDPFLIQIAKYLTNVL